MSTASPARPASGSADTASPARTAAAAASPARPTSGSAASPARPTAASASPAVASYVPPVAASAESILPASGVSHLGKLLFVSAKLYAKSLLSRQEKRVLKQLALRSDPAVLAVDLSGPDFLTQLIDVASSRVIAEASHTFSNVLYRHCSTNQAKTRSKTERKERGIADNSFVYGEIEFLSFSQIIKEIRPIFKPDGVFTDLGSGTGRPSFAMALLSDCKRIVGIEALSSLAAVSREILEKYEDFVEADEEGPAAAAAGASGSPARIAQDKKTINSPLAKKERKASISPSDKRLQFIEGDFLQIDWWSDSDLVFINSTCYSPALMTELSRLAEKLRPGAVVVSLTKSLQSEQFNILSKKKFLMSWGSATAYVHQRK